MDSVDTRCEASAETAEETDKAGFAKLTAVEDDHVTKEGIHEEIAELTTAQLVKAIRNFTDLLQEFRNTLSRDDPRLEQIDKKTIVKIAEEITREAIWLRKLSEYDWSTHDLCRLINKKISDLDQKWSSMLRMETVKNPMYNTTGVPMRDMHELIIFNVCRDSYSTLVDYVRDRLSDHDQYQTYGKSYLLCYQTPNTKPNKWILIKLIGENNETATVALRSDNGYLQGFSNSTGQWFELRVPDAKGVNYQYLDGSLLVNCEVHYASMLRLDSEEDPPISPVALERMTQLILGKLSMLKDVKRLSRFKYTLGGYINEQTRKALARIAFTLSEAFRMFILSCIVINGWDCGTSYDKLQCQYIWEWKEICSMLLIPFIQGGQYFITDRLQRIGITDPEKGFAVVCLLLNKEGPGLEILKGDLQVLPASDVEAGNNQLPPSGQAEENNKPPKLGSVAHPSPAQSSSDSNNNERQNNALHKEDGRFLVEIFSLSVNVNFFGTVLVSDECHSQYIHHHMYRVADPRSGIPTPGSRQSKNLLLTGPSCAISAENGFCVEVDIPGRIVKGLLTDEDHGEKLWDWNELSKYDEPDTLTVETRMGQSIHMNFVVLSAAVEATVTLQLEVLYSHGIYGYISARIDKFDHEIMLFSRVPEEPLGSLLMSPNFPLDRSVLSVPVGSNLYIKGRLHCGEKPFDLFFDDVVPVTSERWMGKWEEHGTCRSKISLNVRSQGHCDLAWPVEEMDHHSPVFVGLKVY